MLKLTTPAEGPRVAHHNTKRNLLKAIAPLALLCVGLLLWRTHSTPSVFRELTELSRADFAQIQKATRRAMWQKAFPKGAWWSGLTSPRVVWQLATSRIRSVEVFTDADVQVQTRSLSGDYFYHLVKGEPDAAHMDWRVLSSGPQPQVHVISLNGWGAVNVVRVKGGIGLIGGTLYSGPDEEELMSLLRRDNGASSTNDRASSDSRRLVSVADPIRLTYENRPPLHLDVMPGPENHNRPAFSETEFSAWLSNRAALKLGP